MAELLGIARRAGKRAPMETLSTARISPECGVASDFRGRPGKRQVTLLSLADWRAACAELGNELDWTARRSNLLVDHLPWADLVGRRLAVGTALLEVCVEIDPCSRMDETAPGLMQALLPGWRGGAGCRVVEGGEIVLGALVTIVA